VRAVARCFGELATSARTLGLTDRTLNELTAAGVPPADGWGDLVWHTDIRYSAGFLKPCPACPFGSSDRAFGADGAGGAFGFADPDLGYAYAPNRMGFHLFDDPREQSLRTAVYRCLGVQPRTPRATADRRAATPVGRPTMSTASPGLSWLLPAGKCTAVRRPPPGRHR
jgi:hypothetical protein